MLFVGAFWRDDGVIIVMMGPCGCGKTTVGSALAARLGGAFMEGDSYHPEENRTKMSAGEPLTDDDRWPWLDLISSELQTHREAGTTVVLACSALKRTYRDRLRRADPGMLFVLLEGPKALLLERLTSRRDHFMPPALLDSQLEALEAPGSDESAFTVDVALTPAQMVDQIVAQAAAVQG